ncbi:MAG: ABC transporter permease subunit [Clostridiales bacterium]|jgi:putative aldouronate transport system permease protein|nr:ABC transporter permease subunit [Clostridiales bacterium]
MATATQARTIGAKRSGKGSGAGLSRRIFKFRWIYLMLLPPLAYFFIFRYMPLYGIQLAFKDYVLKGIAASPWNDFAHFKYMFLEPGFVPAFRNTLIISFLRILIGFPFPIILAILINEVRMRRFKRVLQTVYTFPHFLSWVLLSGIMLNLLGSNGMVRKAVGLFSSGAFDNWNLLYDGGAFRWLLVFSDMWKEAGWGTIIYLASIAGIDQALYESADIDGASRLQKIAYLTLPGIASMIAIQFVLRVGAIMEGGFDQVFNLYSAPVFAQGDIIDTYIYRLSFVRASGVNLGFPTAVGLFKNIINFVLLLAANAFARALGQKSVL